MNGYYNPNGQFGEWGQPTFSLYGQQPINFINPEHKKSDKKILRKIGFYSGLAILLYSVFAEIIGLIIRLLARVFPDTGIKKWARLLFAALPMYIIFSRMVLYLPKAVL